MNQSVRQFTHHQKRRQRLALIGHTAAVLSFIVEYLVGWLPLSLSLTLSLLWILFGTVQITAYLELHGTLLIEADGDCFRLHRVDRFTHRKGLPSPWTFHRHDVRTFSVEERWPWSWSDDYIIEVSVDGETTRITIPSAEIAPDQQEEFRELFEHAVLDESD